MLILSIDTSCDETAAAVTEGRKVLSNVIYSQVLLYKKWGGVVPSIAKRAHEERIDYVIETVLKKAKVTMEQIDCIAVTYGPGLAIALEVGVNKAKELVQKYNKKLVAVNHMEGHLYSSFVQNSQGNPSREFNFPYLGLLVSGGHTEIVLFKNHLEYEVLGETLDDAAGEALDKAARMLGFGYPGGPVLERLASEVKNVDKFHFPRPLYRSPKIEFSFSGLKTSFLYFLRKIPETEKNEQLHHLASSFQEAVFDSLLAKTELAIKKTGINRLVVGGGVSVNKHLRIKLKQLITKYQGAVYFPPFKYLNFDNAAMIGVAAAFRAEKGLFVEDAAALERVPRLSLLQSTSR